MSVEPRVYLQLVYSEKYARSENCDKTVQVWACPLNLTFDACKDVLIKASRLIIGWDNHILKEGLE